MITIQMEEPGSDNFELSLTDSYNHNWQATVSERVRIGMKAATNREEMFAKGGVLARSVAPLTRFNPDPDKLKTYLQTQSVLHTNDPATPWEVMAWGTGNDHSFWGVQKPVVRMHSGDQPLSEQDLRQMKPLQKFLIVVSDPVNKYKLLAPQSRAVIESWLPGLSRRVLWNPPKSKVIEEIRIGYDLIIFIGHASYTRNTSGQSKFDLPENDHLIPKDLNKYLGGQPVILFIACLTAQHAPANSGPAAMPAIGFMAACLDRNAAAYIAPLWEIEPDRGLLLAGRLLPYLQSNPPGEALRLMRRDAVDQTPHDVTWAAFVVYQRSLSLLPPPPPPPPPPSETLWKKALEQYEQKDYLGALETLTQLQALLSEVKKT